MVVGCAARVRIFFASWALRQAFGPKSKIQKWVPKAARSKKQVLSGREKQPKEEVLGQDIPGTSGRWSRMSGRRTSGTSRPSLGFSFIF